MLDSLKAKRRVLSFTALALAAIAVAALLLSFPPPVQGQQPTLTVGFGSETISDKTYTAGARVNQVFDTTAGDQGLPKLPEATVTNFSVPDGKTAYYTVAYTAAGLPDGLSLGRDRVIRGTPTTATTEAATVSYFATVTVYTWNGSAFVLDFTQDTTETLAFNVTVNQAVTFDAEAQKFIDSKIIVWVDGQGWRDSESDGTIIFPAATGGTGTLTYSLIDNDSGKPLADAASGITFDTATRKLGGTPSSAAQKTWAVTYAAEDENGGRASGSTTVYAGGWGVGGL